MDATRWALKAKVSHDIGFNPSCGRSSVVEFQPSKLAVAGSNPVARSIFLGGFRLAYLIEGKIFSRK